MSEYEIRDVALAAAVIGRYVDRGLLRAGLDLSGSELDDVIGELEGTVVLESWGTEC